MYKDSLKEIAVNVRAELKKTFPGVKFSVKLKRYSGGGNVSVQWNNWPTQKTVDDVVRKFATNRTCPDTFDHLGGYFVFCSMGLDDAHHEGFINSLPAETRAMRYLTDDPNYFDYYAAYTEKLEKAYLSAIGWKVDPPLEEMIKNYREQQEQQKIKAVKIEIQRLEGDAYECRYLYTFQNWKDANDKLARMALTAPDTGAYDKTDFKVYFKDGYVYEGRFDLQYKHASRKNLLNDHINDFLDHWPKCYAPDKQKVEDFRSKYDVPAIIEDSKQLDLSPVNSFPSNVVDFAAFRAKKKIS